LIIRFEPTIHPYGKEGMLLSVSCRDYPPLVLVRGKIYSMLSMKARKIRWQNRKPIHSLSLFD